MARRIWLARYGSRVYCCSGRPNTCNNLRLLQAAESGFHDQRLKEGTERINEILAELRDAPPEGAHLALIDTNEGLLLVWATGIDRPDDLTDYTWHQSPQEEIRSVLGIDEAVASA